MRGRDVGEGDVVVPDAPQTRQDLQDGVKRLKKLLDSTWAKGVTMRSSPCLGGEVMRMVYSLVVYNYVDVAIVHIDQQQDRAIRLIRSYHLSFSFRDLYCGIARLQ